MPEQRVVVEERADVVLLVLRGEIDLSDGEELHAAATRALDAPAPVTVVDISALEFADSTVLNFLLRAQRDHRRRGSRMLIAGPVTENVEHLLAVTGTRDHLPIVDDLAAAVRQAATPPQAQQ
jgi:anti-sigma B factor antagonist